MISLRQVHFLKPAMISALLFAMVFGGTGCGLPMKWQKLANKLPEATEADPVYDMICIWEPAEGVDPEGKPTRGFAGQISFFTRRQNAPVRVHGDVMIAVFDDQGTPEERVKPIRQWEFLGDAWSIHLHDGTLGATYSVFIPYTRKGNHQAQCALQVKFTPLNGAAPIYSDTVAVLLPGPLRKKDNQPVNAESKTDKRSSLQSITIPLKERRRVELANMPIGQSEMHRTVAPVSELAKQAARTQSNSEPVDVTQPAAIATLPTAPRSVTPAVMPVNPVFETAPVIPTVPATSTAPPEPNRFSQTTQPKPVGSHPLLESNTWRSE